MKRSMLVLLLPVIFSCNQPPPAVQTVELKDTQLHSSELQPGEGYVLIPWQLANSYVDRPALVYGQVIRTGRGGPASRCYLNFHKDRERFTAVIDSKAFSEFAEPPERLFDNKRVVVCGLLSNELSRPEMSITSADQILIIPEDQPDAAAFARAHYPGAVTPDEVQGMRPPRVFTDTIRIGTYNLLNLFDEYDDPYRNDDVMDPKPREELERLAQRIRQLDADVLAVQEVENRFYLERFVHSFLPDMGYDHIELIEGNNQRGIDCAVVSRIPFGPITSYRHLTFPGPDGKTYRFLRDLLRVTIAGPQGFSFDLFVVHLKSKYGGAERSEPARQAEAGKIRELLDQILYQDPGARFVICGDFNDLWDSPSLKTIRGSGQTLLSCPGVELPKAQRITYNRQARYRSMIDFIMCSPGMHDRYVPGSYRIIHGSVEDSGSDHNPSVASFQFR